MAEFSEVTRQWGRMCNAMLKTDDACKGCGLGGNFRMCGEFPMAATREDYAEVERVVMAWAAEHPEPVYPTWFEWLEDVGIVSKKKSEYSQIYDTVLPTLKLFEPIPADIAEKLGVEPKEDI